MNLIFQRDEFWHLWLIFAGDFVCAGIYCPRGGNGVAAAVTHNQCDLSEPFSYQMTGYPLRGRCVVAEWILRVQAMGAKAWGQNRNIVL